MGYSPFQIEKECNKLGINPRKLLVALDALPDDDFAKCVAQSGHIKMLNKIINDKNIEIANLKEHVSNKNYRRLKDKYDSVSKLYADLYKSAVAAKLQRNEKD